MPPYEPREKFHEVPLDPNEPDESTATLRLGQLFYELTDFGVMLDGSLFTPGAVEDTIQLIENYKDTDITYYVSAQFVNAVDHYIQHGREFGTDAISFFEAYDSFENLEDLERTYEIITTSQPLHSFDISEEFGAGDIEGDFLSEYICFVGAIDAA